MTTFTVVPDSVLEPGDPIRSVDIIAIKENTNYNHESTVLELLETQTVTSTGTWTKASGYDSTDTVIMFIIGGGGSGGAVRYTGTGHGAAGGGTSGGIVIVYGNYSSFPSSLYVIIGAGGAAVTRTTAGATPGNNGNATNIRVDSVSSVDIWGAQGAQNGNAAQAASSVSAISKGSSLIGYGQTSSNKLATELLKSTNDGIGIGAKSDTGTSDDRLELAFNSLFVSGGGGAGRQATTDRTVYNASVPGYLNTGGNGSGTANGGNGSLGSGGGGCVRLDANATSGAGGDGVVIVQYFRGSVAAAQLVRS
jgi:hypothetical protein